MHTGESLETFFQDQVDAALREQGLSAGALTGHYLVQLLAGYASQPIDDKPLAFRLLDALEATPRERRLQLREIGDTSLYVSGFWSESFARKLVDVDYYIGVGESAYGELARAPVAFTRDPFGDVFEELARNFERFVKVLASVSRRLIPEPSPQDVVKLYERWRRTGSRWAAGRLAAFGVVALPSDSDGRPQ
jgi:hypothetical protein